MSFKDLNWMTNLDDFKIVENFHLEEMKKRENEEPKFKVIGDPLHNEIQDIFKNKNLINIFGNGPSLQKIKENNNHINFCINMTVAVQEKCDILFLGDLKVLFHLFDLNKDILKNVKIIMIQSPLHGFHGFNRNVQVCVDRRIGLAAGYPPLHPPRSTPAR